MTSHPLDTISPDAAARDRPLMLFFRCRRSGPAAFLQSRTFEQQSGLKQSFEVIVFDGDQDYDGVCIRLALDLCVFGSGTYAGERSIADTSSHPEIPTLELLHVDGVDASRTAFIADMAKWDFRWFFTMSMSIAEFTPEFITLTMPHFDWESEASTARMVQGGDRTRLHGANLLVQIYGSVTKDALRKHLEIPASGACFVTEKTASIETFGFVDMVNCVSATGGGLVQKCNTLLEGPENFGRITAAGQDLVHRHHSVQRRSQILQWFRLISIFGHDIIIDQFSPEGALLLARGAARVASGGLDKLLATVGWPTINQNIAMAAEVDFPPMVNFYFIPDEALGVENSYFELDDLRAAKEWISQLPVTAVSHRGAFEPDLVPWAYKIRVLLCEEDNSRAVAPAQRYPDIRNPEFDRIRAGVMAVMGVAISRNEDALRPATMCPGPETDEASWTSQLAVILQACGEKSSKDRLTGLASLSIGTPALHRGKFRMDVRLSQVRAGDTPSTSEPWLRARLSSLKSRVTTEDWSQCLGDFVQAEPLNQALLITTGQVSSTSARRIHCALAENPQLLGVESVDVGALTDIAPGTGVLEFVTAAGSQIVNDVHSLDGASVTVLAGLDGAPGHRILETFVANCDYSVIDHYPDDGSGNAICDIMTAGSPSERRYSFHSSEDEGHLPMSDARSIPLMNLSLQHAQVSEEVHEGLNRITAAGRLVLGPEADKFTMEFAANSGVSVVVGFGNGTCTLELALRAHDIWPCLEVIIPANTFVAAAESVHRTGATVRVVDCDKNFLTDAHAVCGQITERTSVVFGVFLCGQIIPIELLRSAKSDDILIGEDAAQPQGPRRFGLSSGGLGDTTGGNFERGKELGAHGDGGRTLTNCAEVADFMLRKRYQGDTRRHSHPVAGANSRLDGFHGGVLSAKLLSLDRWNDDRRAAPHNYDELRTHHADVIVVGPKVIEGNEHVFHLYIIRTARRDSLIESVNSEGGSPSIRCSLTGARYPRLRGSGKCRRIPPSGRAARVGDHATADLPKHHERAGGWRCRHLCEVSGRLSPQLARIVVVAAD